jgi:hypothetical protein
LPVAVVIQSNYLSVKIPALQIIGWIINIASKDRSFDRYTSIDGAESKDLVEALEKLEAGRTSATIGRIGAADGGSR